MYLEKKKIGKNEYNYLKTSFRNKGKVETKTVAYLGKGDLTKKDLEEAIKKYRKKEEQIKKGSFEENSFLDNEKLKKVEKIKREYKEKLKKLDEKTKEDMFNDFLILYSYNTNAIEGNTFTLRDTELLLNKNITPSGKNLREVNDHLNAKSVFLSVLKNKFVITHENIIKLHSKLMKNVDERVGSYRAGNVRVFGAKFKTSSFEYIKTDITILLRWYRSNRKKLHPLVLASMFHHKFEKIHPFYDGNGRTGRMLMNIILFQNELPFLIVPDSQRKKYYDCLEKADKEEYVSLIEFFYFNLLKSYTTVFDRWT
jgi:Fic family protein